MKAKPRWMKSAIATARDDRTLLPFQRTAKAQMLTPVLKKAANG